MELQEFKKGIEMKYYFSYLKVLWSLYGSFLFIILIFVFFNISLFLFLFLCLSVFFLPIAILYTSRYCYYRRRYASFTFYEVDFVESIPSLFNRKYYYICYIPALNEKIKIKMKFETPLKVIKHGTIGYNLERKEEILFSICD